MKKIFAFFLCLTMILTVSACKDSQPAENRNDEPAVTVSPYSVEYSLVKDGKYIEFFRFAECDGDTVFTTPYEQMGTDLSAADIYYVKNSAKEYYVIQIISQAYDPLSSDINMCMSIATRNKMTGNDTYKQSADLTHAQNAYNDYLKDGKDAEFCGRTGTAYAFTVDGVSHSVIIDKQTGLCLYHSYTENGSVFELSATNFTVDVTKENLFDLSLLDIVDK